jgi:hypothetical protein
VHHVALLHVRGTRPRARISHATCEAWRLHASVSIMSNGNKEPKRPDSADAFVPDPIEHHKRLKAEDAEWFAEEFIATATSAEDVQEDARDEVVDEEQGGPFIIEDDSVPDTIPDLPRKKKPSSRRQPA